VYGVLALRHGPGSALPGGSTRFASAHWHAFLFGGELTIAAIVLRLAESVRQLLDGLSKGSADASELIEQSTPDDGGFVDSCKLTSYPSRDGVVAVREVSRERRQHLGDVTGEDHLGAALGVVERDLVGLLFRQSLTLGTGRRFPVQYDPRNRLFGVDLSLATLATGLCGHSRCDPGGDQRRRDSAEPREAVASESQ
jgi:hypothetical protein